ncbi:MAG: RING finger domain-containing protein, partial [Chlamydiota bacterium]|nr:RING finger domain-containing protein [Chlamydiota bacterium]
YIYSEPNKMAKEVKLESKNKNDTCAICFQELAEDNSTKKVTKTACNHYFHTECIGAWLATKNNCPKCREEARPEVKISNINIIKNAMRKMKTQDILLEILIIRNDINLLKRNALLIGKISLFISQRIIDIHTTRNELLNSAWQRPYEDIRATSLIEILCDYGFRDVRKGLFILFILVQNGLLFLVGTLALGVVSGKLVKVPGDIPVKPMLILSSAYLLSRSLSYLIIEPSQEGDIGNTVARLTCKITISLIIYYYIIDLPSILEIKFNLSFLKPHSPCSREIWNNFDCNAFLFFDVEYEILKTLFKICYWLVSWLRNVPQ